MFFGDGEHVQNLSVLVQQQIHYIRLTGHNFKLGDVLLQTESSPEQKSTSHFTYLKLEAYQKQLRVSLAQDFSALLGT